MTADDRATAVRKHCDLLFTGSIPLADAREVLTALGTRFGRYLKRFPDGETGPRTVWIQYQEQVFRSNPSYERGEAEPDWRNPLAPEGKRLDIQFRLRPGVRPDTIRFGDLGYVEPAVRSFADFRALKEAGVIPSGARLMVAMPSPYNVMSWGVVAEFRLVTEGPYEDAMRREVERMCAEIPHEELAIQWDCARDMQAFDGARESYFSPDKPGIIDRLVKAGEWVPRDVELGYHLCYGSFGGRHFVEPKDMRAMVDLTNGIARGIRRPIAWVHMPVPIERSDDAYFAPLADLRIDKATGMYLGLIHEADGVEGTRRKIAAAERYLPDFGIGTECGFGRLPPETARRILDAHARLLDAIC